MARGSLPPGFRFHPTDVELVMYYLKRKIMGKRFHFEAISEIDMYKFAPWDLPDKACLKSRDLEWYFFCPRDRKYGTGQRVNRTADVGYWKTTGKDRHVYYDLRVVGMRKTLIFHTGKAPHGGRTDWVVHEYRLEDKRLTDAGISQENYVLCRLFKKSGLGPQNGAQYGAPYVEEEWEDDEETEGGFCSSVSVAKYHPLAAASASQNIHNSQAGDTSVLMVDTSAIRGNLINAQVDVEHCIPAAAVGGSCVPEPSREYTSIDNGEAIPPEDPIIRLLCQELEEENESQFLAIFNNPNPPVHNQAYVTQRAESFDDPGHTARQLSNTAHNTARQLSNTAHNFTTLNHPDLIQDYENYLLQNGCQSQNYLDDRGGFIEINDLWSMPG